MKQQTKTETYVSTVEQTSVSIVQSAVQAVRTKNVTRNARRLYDGVHIGVAGSLGAMDSGELTDRASAALSLGVPYPFEPTVGGSRHERVKSAISGSQIFVDEIEGLLADLSTRHPQFIFSNKANLTTRTVRLANDNGLDYSWTTTSAEIEMIVKEKQSANLIDTYLGFEGPGYRRDAVLAIADMVCGGFLRSASMPAGRHPVCFFSTDATYLSKMTRALNGLLLGSGSSLFSGKVGQRLFSEDLTIYQSRSPKDEVHEPFFDFEGTTNEEDRFRLIADGVLRAGYTNRAYAGRYDLPLTGAADGEYDSIPDLGTPELVIESSPKTAAELLDGRPALLVFIASGGDFTPDGKYATPVQAGYVFDGERIIGRAPQLSLSSHLYDMFGSSFIGVSSNSILPDTPSKVFVAEMEVG